MPTRVLTPGTPNSGTSSTGSSLKRTAVKTTAYTAVAGDLVPVDTTSGAVTITLPNAPADKTLVAVKHIVQGGAAAVTVACAGVDVFNKAGGATSGSLPLVNQAFLLQYDSTAHVWSVLADDLPLSVLDVRYLTVADAHTVAPQWVFTTLPQVHSSGSDATPIQGRTSTDGLTVGAWNIQDDGIAGDLIHVTLGPNHHNNPNGCAFAVGVAYAGWGYFANNYGDLDGLGGNTFGMGVTNLASVTSANSAGFQGTQKSAGTPLMVLRSVAADALTTLAPLLQMGVGVALDTDLPMAKFVVGSGAGSTVGQIMGDNGDITWNRSIEAVAPSSGITPLIRVVDEASPAPSETYLGAKSNGELGLRIYRRSGTASTMYAFGLLASSDRLKLQVAQGAANKGSEVLSTMIECRAIAGTGSLGQMGFFGASPTNRPAAYTQTYATATRSHAARQAAALTDSSGGTSGGTTVAAVTDVATAANAIATLAAMVNKVITDQVNTAGVLNSAVDDLQALGLAG